MEKVRPFKRMKKETDPAEPLEGLLLLTNHIYVSSYSCIATHGQTSLAFPVKLVSNVRSFGCTTDVGTKEKDKAKQTKIEAKDKTMVH